jgi:hypothetical protein
MAGGTSMSATAGIVGIDKAQTGRPASRRVFFDSIATFRDRAPIPFDVAHRDHAARRFSFRLTPQFAVFARLDRAIR